MRVEARGDWIKTWINDVPAAEVVDAKDLEGFIGLQVHGVGKREEPLTVAWRKLRLQDLGRRAWRPLVPGQEKEKVSLPAALAPRGEGKFDVTSQIAGTLPAGAAHRPGCCMFPAAVTAGACLRVPGRGEDARRQRRHLSERPAGRGAGPGRRPAGGSGCPGAGPGLYEAGGEAGCGGRTRPRSQPGRMRGRRRTC